MRLGGTQQQPGRVDEAQLKPKSVTKPAHEVAPGARSSERRQQSGYVYSPLELPLRMMGRIPG